MLALVRWARTHRAPISEVVDDSVPQVWRFEQPCSQVLRNLRRSDARSKPDGRRRGTARLGAATSPTATRRSTLRTTGTATLRATHARLLAVERATN